MDVEKNDEMEIRCAINLLKTEYPKSGAQGLWGDPPEPMDTPEFICEAKSCLAWLRAHGLENKQIKTYPDSTPTSYGFKHIVESYNSRRGIEPHYIRNGAFIVAMIACGYQVKKVDKLNAGFNISAKAVKIAIRED